jgi:hypothetical protein
MKKTIKRKPTTDAIEIIDRRYYDGRRQRLLVHAESLITPDPKNPASEGRFLAIGQTFRAKERMTGFLATLGMTKEAWAGSTLKTEVDRDGSVSGWFRFV